jgi:hypothetical protein
VTGVRLTDAEREALCICGEPLAGQTEADSDRLTAACEGNQAAVERILTARLAAHEAREDQVRALASRWAVNGATGTDAESRCLRAVAAYLRCALDGDQP